MELTEAFEEWMQVFADDQAELLDFYYDACDQVPEWLETNHDNIRQFRDELAAHICDSSIGPYPSETQWTTDEILRDQWFDIFGPEPSPGDPYPVPRERWARRRMTTYMRDIPWREPGLSLVPEKTQQWLAARGITFDDLAAYREPGAEIEFSRPEPPGYRERLAELTAQGRRSGPVQGEHADRAMAELIDTKQSYLDRGHPGIADAIDKAAADRQPRDEPSSQ